MVFVSFTFRDLDIAERLVATLETADVACVRANLSKIPEDELCAAIESRLIESTHSIVVTSPGEPVSPWVAFESGFAVALRHPLYTFGSSDDQLPPFLAQWPSIPDWQSLSTFIRLFHATSALDQQDHQVARLTTVQDGLQFQGHKHTTWSTWSKELHRQAMQAIAAIR
jgi:hypothetical protein